MTLQLNIYQRAELKNVHKQERYRRCADRIKAVLLIDSGLSFEKVSEYLLLDDQTIRNYIDRYKRNGIDDLLNDNYTGSAAKLSKEQEEQLKENVKQNFIGYPEGSFNLDSRLSLSSHALSGEHAGMTVLGH